MRTLISFLGAAAILILLALIGIGAYYFSNSAVINEIASNVPKLEPKGHETLLNLMGVMMTVITVVIGIVTVVFTGVVHFGVQAQGRLRDLQIEYKDSLDIFEEVRDHLIFERYEITTRIESLVSLFISAYLSSTNTAILELKQKGGANPTDRVERSSIIFVEEGIDPLSIMASTFRLRETLASLDVLGNCCFRVARDGIAVPTALHLLLRRQSQFGSKREISDKERRDVQAARGESATRFRADSNLLCDLLDKLPRSRESPTTKQLLDSVIEFVDYLHAEGRILRECTAELRFLRTDVAALNI